MGVCLLVPPFFVWPLIARADGASGSGIWKALSDVFQGHQDLDTQVFDAALAALEAQAAPQATTGTSDENPDPTEVVATLLRRSRALYIKLQSCQLELRACAPQMPSSVSAMRHLSHFLTTMPMKDRSATTRILSDPAVKERTTIDLRAVLEKSGDDRVSCDHATTSSACSQCLAHVWTGAGCVPNVAALAVLTRDMLIVARRRLQKACVDDKAYTDPVYGNTCSSWVGRLCTTASGLTAEQAQNLQLHCPNACRVGCPEGNTGGNDNHEDANTTLDRSFQRKADDETTTLTTTFLRTCAPDESSRRRVGNYNCSSYVKVGGLCGEDSENGEDWRMTCQTSCHAEAECWLGCESLSECPSAYGCEQSLCKPCASISTEVACPTIACTWTGTLCQLGCTSGSDCPSGFGCTVGGCTAICASDESERRRRRLLGPEICHLSECSSDYTMQQTCETTCHAAIGCLIACTTASACPISHGCEEGFCQVSGEMRLGMYS